MARPAGLEPATYGLEGRCSIRLSYGRTLKQFKIQTENTEVLNHNQRLDTQVPPSTLGSGRGGGIRTPDILLPKQARYQTALHPDLTT